MSTLCIDPRCFVPMNADQNQCRWNTSPNRAILESGCKALREMRTHFRQILLCIRYRDTHGRAETERRMQQWLERYKIPVESDINSKDVIMIGNADFVSNLKKHQVARYISPIRDDVLSAERHGIIGLLFRQTPAMPVIEDVRSALSWSEIGMALLSPVHKTTVVSPEIRVYHHDLSRIETMSLTQRVDAFFNDHRLAAYEFWLYLNRPERAKHKMPKHFERIVIDAGLLPKDGRPSWDIEQAVLRKGQELRAHYIRR